MLRYVTTPILVVLLSSCSVLRAESTLPHSESNVTPQFSRADVATASCGSSLYVANENNGTVTVYGAGSGTPVRTISLSTGGYQGALGLIMGVDKLCNLYVMPDCQSGCSGAATLAVYATGAVIPTRTIQDLGAAPDAMAFDRSNNLYIADGAPRFGGVYEYAAGTDTLVQTFTAIAPPALAFDATGNWLYVLSKGQTGEMRVFKPKAGTKPIWSVRTDVNAPANLVLTSDDTIYVANEGGSAGKPVGPSIAEYSASEPVPERSFSIAEYANTKQTLAVDSGGRLYVLEGNTVVVFSGHRARIIRTLSVHGWQPTAILIDASDHLYVASAPSGATGAVYEFAPHSEKVLRTISSGVSTPVALIIGP